MRGEKKRLTKHRWGIGGVLCVCACVLVIAFCLTLGGRLSVAEAATSGSCGSNVNWSYNESTKNLTISGTGNMTGYDYYYDRYTPWYSYYEDIQTVTIESGVTNIGSYAFKDCINLKSVTVPSGVTSIGERAFVAVVA